MLRLIVFDCDGVMFDSWEANKNYYNDLLRSFNRPPMYDDELEFVHCHNVNESVAHIFRHYPDTDLGAVHQHRQTVSYTPYLSHMTIKPDLIEFLDKVQPHYKLAISTNRTTTMRPLLETYGLSDYFELVVTAMDVENPKPAPDALLKIFDYFNCKPEETIFIGDSEIDQKHTESTGVDLIAFKNTLLAAPYHVECFLAILDLEAFKRPTG